MSRTRARQLAQAYIERQDPTGWFEALYAIAAGDPSQISWADLVANPSLVEWLARYQMGDERRAVVVGCGLGDDAEELASRGFDVVAFDVSETAIGWCKKRFPDSKVTYALADLFQLPPEWVGAFDLVLEAYTLQVLPPTTRARAIEGIASLAAPEGTLLVLCRGRDTTEEDGHMPWPLTRREVEQFRAFGMEQVSFEDYFDGETPPVRRFRAEFLKRRG
jgi:SAM-dependent methyltransferase